MEAALDLVGNVGNDLDRASSEITAAFLLENTPVYLTGGDIGVFGETFIDEALVMS